MRNKILSVLMIMLVAITFTNGVRVEASNYGNKVKSIELTNYYNTGTDFTDSDVLFGTGYYDSEDDLTGTYEFELGKNLIDSVELGSIASANGENIASIQRIRSVNHIKVDPNTEYTLSAINLKDSTNLQVIIMQYDLNLGYISTTGFSNNPLTLTLGSNTEYVRVLTRFIDDSVLTLDDINLQLELGDTATEFELYGSIKRVDNTPVDLTDSVYDLTDYQVLQYVNNIGAETDYDNLLLSEILGNSLYGVGRTNIFDNTTNYWSGSYNESEDFPITRVNGLTTIIIDASHSVPDSTHYMRMYLDSSMRQDNHTYYHSFDVKVETNIDVSFNFTQYGLYNPSLFYAPDTALDPYPYTLPEQLTDYVNINNLYYTGTGMTSGFINFNSHLLYNNRLSADSTFSYTGIEKTTIFIKNEMLYDLTDLFVNEPSREQFESLIRAYQDVTDYGEGTFNLRTPELRQDDLTYLQLIENSDTPLLFNLTEAFTGETIPSMTDFYDNLIYDSVNNKYYFNIVTVDESVIQLDCQYNVDNLIENGDFSNGQTGWTVDPDYTTYSIPYSFTNGYFYHNVDVLRDLWIDNLLDEVIDEYNTSLYGSFDFKVKDYGIDGMAFRLYGSAGTVTYLVDNNFPFVEDEWITYNEYIDLNTWNRPVQHFAMWDFGTIGELYLDNVILVNPTNYYGTNLEPDKTQLESVIDFSTWSSVYTYDDKCSMTMEQNTAIYQYYSTTEGANAEVELVFTDSVYGIEEVMPKIIVEKYDLDLNYLGVLDDVYVGNESDLNGDNFLEHTYNFMLPEPTATETGYIYQVKNGEGGTLLTSGYVYDSVGSSFTSSATGIRDTYNAIGVDDTVYNTGTGYLFDNSTPLTYQYNDNEEFVLHYRYSSLETPYINFYNENSLQDMSLYVEDVYTAFNEGYNDIVYEGYFIIDISESYPMLLKMLSDSNVNSYNTYIDDVLDFYEFEIKGIFNDSNFADNYGVYTYELVDNVGGNLARGESPIYYFSQFNTLELTSHLARTGNPFTVKIIKYNEYLEEVYNFQYIYDSNTLVSNFDYDVLGDNSQTIHIDVFKGVGDETGLLNYRINRTSGVFRNGSVEDAYNVYLFDSYTIKEPLSISDNIDNSLDSIGLNNVFGRLLISVVVIAIVAIAVYVKSQNIIATLLASFVVLGIAFVLGLIEAWIILFVVMILFMMTYFMYSRTSV